MRNWAFLLNDRAQRVRTAIVLAATALMIAAIMVSLKQMPRAARVDHAVKRLELRDATGRAVGRERRERVFCIFGQGI